jgi:exonuclease III
MPDGQVMTWAQRESKRKGVVTRRNFRGGDGKRWDTAERNILLGLGHYDLADVFRSLHGYQVKEFSWYADRENLLIGRRFDHIFASAGLRPESCNYLHKFREGGLSDHSPIEAIFQI